TSSRPNASPSTGTLTPGVRPASAMAFVTWSATRTPTASSHRAAGSRRRRTSCESRPTAAGPSLRTVDLALGTGTGTCEGTAPLDVVEQTLEVALEAGAVVALEHAELVALALEQRALALELAERAVALLLGLAGDPLGLGTGLGEDALGLRLAVAHVLVVDALRQRDQAGRGLRLALRRLRRGGGVGGRRGRLRLGLRLDGRLGDRGHLLRALLGRRRSGGRLLQAPLGGLQLGLELAVLGVQRAQRVDDLVEEVIDLVLVVALAELGRLELLVEDVVRCQQRHVVVTSVCRSFGSVATDQTSSCQENLAIRLLSTASPIEHANITMRNARSSATPPILIGRILRRSHRSGGSVTVYTASATTRAIPRGFQSRANTWTQSKTSRISIATTNSSSRRETIALVHRSLL